MGAYWYKLLKRQTKLIYEIRMQSCAKLLDFVFQTTLSQLFRLVSTSWVPPTSSLDYHSNDFSTLTSGFDSNVLFFS